MPIDIDPSFRKSGAQARARRKRRQQIRLAVGGGVLVLGLLIGGGAWLLTRGGDTDTEIATLPEDPGTAPVAEDIDGIEDDVVFAQTEESAESGIVASVASFIDLRRDPMILRLEQGGAESAIRTDPGPAGLSAARVGLAGEQRLSVLREPLVIGEMRLTATLPSTREDFALFQAQRAQGMAELAEQDDPETDPGEVAAGETVEVSGEDGSWGSLIGEDGGAAESDAAVYVETRIENTTSVALMLRQDQRAPLYDDIIVVTRTERALDEILISNGFSKEQAERIAAAARRIGGLPDAPLGPGSIVALRVRNDTMGQTLLQASVYGPDGYLFSLAQTGIGRFAPAADPWIEVDLLARSGAIRREAVQNAEVRLLDAVYGAGIRNGLSTTMVGELIVMMSQVFDLDRFAAEGDAFTLVYATEPGRDGTGTGQILYAAIEGPSGEMRCYVWQDEENGWGCYDFERGGGGGAGQLGGGFIVPVSGTKTSDFGPRWHPILKQNRNHNGVDWAAPTGTPVYAAGPGRVSYAGVAGGYGNVVYIDHGGSETRYAHLNAFADLGKTGAQVQAGDLIGYVGTTGRSTGPHLHFELRVGGQPVDPLSHVGVSSGGQPGSDAVEALVNQIIRVESAGRADAKNPLSTATGLGQFIESTWLRMMRDYRPDLVRTMTRAQLLALRTDPALSREMVRNLARENEAFLRARGHQITPGRLYLAHFLGPAGANKALNANPANTVLVEMGSSVVNANPFLRGKTIADLRAWADRKMVGAGSAPAYGVGSSAPVRAVIPQEVSDYRETIDRFIDGLEDI